MKPRDIEGREVGVRSYAQTAGLWVRGIPQHERGVDLDKVTWLTTDKGQLAEYRDSPNCQMLPKGKRIDEMLYSGEIAAAILGNDMPTIRASVRWSRMPPLRQSNGTSANM